VTPREHAEMLAEGGDEILLADGFEDALLGIQQTFERGGIRYRALYSLKRCVEIMMADGSTYESALEFLQFNTLGAYVGEGTPSFFLDTDLGE
jgi:hypothetical protein